MQKIYYERRLPHWQPPGATFFLTYRLEGSIPMEQLRYLKQQYSEEEQLARERLAGQALETELYDIQRRYFGKYDKALDENPNEPYWLREETVATEVVDSLKHCAERYFHLWAYCIMPNHVHLLIKHHEDAPLLADILQRHKGYTGNICNKHLGRHGAFWQEETYDHVVRDELEFHRIAWYILQNPVKAGLTKSWQDWHWTYAAPDLL